MPKKSLLLHQIKTGMLGALSMCMMHTVRSAWPITKARISNEVPLSKLSELDTINVWSSGIAYTFLSSLADKYNPKFVTGGGLIMLGIVAILTGILGDITLFHDVRLFFPLFVINGIGQALVLPGLCVINANWFEKGKRGLIMGFWNASIYVGNMLGTYYGTVTVHSAGGHRGQALGLAGFSCIVAGTLLIAFIQIKPEDAGFKHQDMAEVEKICDPRYRSTFNEEQIVKAIKKDLKLSQIQDSEVEDEQLLLDVSVATDQQADIELKKPITFREAIVAQFPNVLLAAFGYGCVKGLNFGLLFWFPTHLKDNLNITNPDTLFFISITGEFGKAIGAISIGILSDKLNSRASIIPLCFGIAVIDFLIMDTLTKDNYSLLVLTTLIQGICLGGPYILMGNVMGQDLGKREEDKTGKQAVSSICGLILGIGTFIAGIIQLIIPQCFSILFLFLACISFVGVFILMPMAYEDMVANHVIKERAMTIGEKSDNLGFLANGLVDAETAKNTVDNMICISMQESDMDKL